MASNPMFAVPNFVDAPYSVAFSGGAWSVASPLTNLVDRRLARVARSSSALVASTTFDVDLGAARYVRVLAIPKHNLSLAATIKITASDHADLSAPLYDPAADDVFPVIYPAGVLPFGHPSYVTGRLTQEEWAGGYSVGYTHVLAPPVSARYWRVAISDTANAAGYVELARLVLAWAYQPADAIAEGAKFGWETSSSRTETDGGAAVYTDRPRRRVFSFQIEAQDADEALVFPFDIQRKYGTSAQIFFVWDPDDVEHLHRRSFLGVLRELSPLDYVGYNAVTPSWALIEEL
jgi:hypothetical protein